MHERIPSGRTKVPWTLFRSLFSFTGTRRTHWISFPSRASRPRSRRPWSLRDYEADRQGRFNRGVHFSIVDAFANIRRVLAADGTVWLNVGDSCKMAFDVTRPSMSRNWTGRKHCRCAARTSARCARRPQGLAAAFNRAGRKERRRAADLTKKRSAKRLLTVALASASEVASSMAVVAFPVARFLFVFGPAACSVVFPARRLSPRRRWDLVVRGSAIFYGNGVPVAKFSSAPVRSRQARVAATATASSAASPHNPCIPAFGGSPRQSAPPEDGGPPDGSATPHARHARRCRRNGALSGLRPKLRRAIRDGGRTFPTRRPASERRRRRQPPVGSRAMNETARGRASDIPRGGWVDRWMPTGIRPYVRLSRLDRPIGSWLLLFPCWWSIALASPKQLHLYALFGVGALAMRGAGCTWNDILDRNFDARVARTRDRPLPAGEVTVLQAFAWFLAQLAIGAAILLSLDSYAIWVGAASLPLVALYPLAKRVTLWPQFVLGLAFNWGALLGWGRRSRRARRPGLRAVRRRRFLDARIRHDLRAPGSAGRPGGACRLLGARSRGAGLQAVAAVLLRLRHDPVRRGGTSGRDGMALLDRARGGLFAVGVAGGARRSRRAEELPRKVQIEPTVRVAAPRRNPRWPSGLTRRRETVAAARDAVSRQEARRRLPDPPDDSR